MAWLNKNKKDDSFQPLSEEEIQKKLYGKYKPGNAKILKDDSGDNTLKAKIKAYKKNPQMSVEKENIKPTSYVANSKSVFAEKPVPNKNKDESVVSKVLNKKELDLFTINNRQDSAKKKTKKYEFKIEDPIEKDNNIELKAGISKNVNYKKQDSAQQEKKDFIEKQNNIRIETEQKSVKDEYISSLRIDLMEFMIKIKRMAPMVVLVIVVFAGVGLFALNLWSRNTNNQVNIPDSKSKILKNNVVSKNDSTVTTVSLNNKAVESKNISTEEKMPSDKANMLFKTQNSDKKSLSDDLSLPYYSIQVCTYLNKTQAENLVGKLEEDNYKAYFKELKSSSGRKHYVVFIGKYPTSSKATAVIDKFKQSKYFKTFNDSFIKMIKK